MAETEIVLNGRPVTITHPEGATMEQIEDYARKNVKPETNAGLQTARAGLQGLTFGFSDEIGASVAALAASLRTGEKWSDVYEAMHADLTGKREQFQKDSPKTALAAELAGALMTGGAGFGKALGGKGYQAASNAGKFGRISGVGAAEGAAYGAGTSEPGARMDGATKGAAMGAAAAPVGAGVVNAVGRGVGSVGNYAANKLTRTPKDEAVNVLRDTADAIGMTADDAVEQMEALGSKAVIADLDDSFRVLARAGMNRMGPMRTQGKELVNRRQRTQQKRLMQAIEKSTGQESDAFKGTMAQYIKSRSDKATPLYDQAFEDGLQESQSITALMSDPLMKGPINVGKKWAKSDGDPGNLMKVLHEAKLALDDKIGMFKRSGKRNEARKLLTKKNQLMDAIGEQNPAYIKAVQEFSDESAFINAMELGQKFLKTDADELADMMVGMTKPEMDLVRLGAVRALSRKMDTVGENRDMVSRLLNTKEMRSKLDLVMDNPSMFLRQAGIEDQYLQTRNMMTGNSTTALQQRAGEALDQSIDPGMAKAMSSINPQAIIGGIIDTVTSKKATPETIAALGDMMFKQGMKPDEIRQIFSSPKLRQALGDRYDELIGPYVRAVAAPATVGMSQ